MIVIFSTLLLCCFFQNAHTQIDCATVRCADQTCPNAFIPEGGCCKICPGCTYNGQTYREDEKFFDGCNDCVCSLGAVSCTEKACVGCTHNKKDYAHLEEFRDGCNDCLCEFGRVTCTKTKCPDIDKECPKTDGFGVCAELCPSHEKCKKNELCCSNGCGHQCMKATVTGKGPQGCHIGDKYYPNGKTFHDDCNICSCQDGRAFCTLRACYLCACVVPKCTNPASGDCCPVCDDCEVDGKVYKNGQNVPCSDPCNKCTCSNGNIESKQRQCPEAKCKNPVSKGKGQCCPTCPGE